MARRTHRCTRRNLVLIVLVVVVFAVFIAATILFGRNPVRLYPPDSAELDTKRATPDNAWPLFAEAFNHLPPAPPLTQGPDGRIYEAPEGSIGHLLNIQRPDDDPAVADFFNAFGPTLALVKQGLEKPLLVPPRPEHFTRDRESVAMLYRLVVLLSGSGRWHLEQQSECEAGLTQLVDAYSLALRMTEYADVGGAGTIPLQALCRGVLNASCTTEQLAGVLTRLSAMGPPISDAAKALEADWRAFQRFADAVVEEGSERRRVLPMLFFSRRIDRQMAWILERRDRMLKMVSLPPAEFDKALPELGTLDEQVWHFGNAINKMRRINRLYYQSLAGYELTRIMLALEMYESTQGAYPETLNSLTPAYLESIPVDPYSGHAFSFEVSETGYRLAPDAPPLGTDEEISTEIDTRQSPPGVSL